MPQQTSLFKIRGKVDNQSFYYSKNGGHLIRRINPAMSERVKTEDTFENTRKNAAEFANIAKIMGRLVASFTERNRYVLTPIQSAQLIKKWLKTLPENEMPWGQRSVPPQYLKDIYPSFNRYSKNPLPEDLVNIFTEGVAVMGGAPYYKFQLNDGDGLKLNEGWGEDLRLKGVSGIRVELAAVASTAPAFNVLTHEFPDPKGPYYWLDEVAFCQLGVDTEIFSGDQISNHTLVMDTLGYFEAVCLTVVPYRGTPDNPVYLQNLGSFKAIPFKYDI